MAKKLVIVESPTKAKTIKKFLGKNFEVIASEGHVRDLPKSSLGIDVEDDFEPHYITIRGKGDLVNTLRKAAKKADFVYLATDPDREGEAISYHLSVALKLDPKKYKRITFNEITKNVVKDSLKNAREIDMNLVDAQQARRVLDRLVGYEISPLLWEKLSNRKLSAGRVQSVTLRMIADREKEINDFIPKEYWTMDVSLKVDGMKNPVVFHYTKDIDTEADATAIEKALEGADFTVSEVKTSSRTKKAPLPFTTSTLQQVASSRINFSTRKTMQVAQQLYEGVEVKGQGTVGLITYLRTDSTRISEVADAAAREFIEERFGKENVADKAPEEKTKKNIQDAHEAIRPTDITRTPESLKGLISNDQFKLYKLIYDRFIGSRMQNASIEIKTVNVEAAGHTFRSSTSRVAFAGFLNVERDEEEKKEEKADLSRLEKGASLSAPVIEKKQHFTEPPQHFTEALLVRTMEENGIGRPSTYAPTIATLMNRHYIVKEKKNIFITELGSAVNQIMHKAFPEIVNIDFTANMESLLDGIGDGNVQWKVVVRNFYPDLEQEVKNARENVGEIKIEPEVSDVLCEKCGSHMIIRYGRFGKFLACPNFPECSNTKPFLEKIGVPCPKCSSDLVRRFTKKGRPFYGCMNFPECDFVSWAKPISKKCPRCGQYMVVKGKKIACSDPECGYTEQADEKDAE